MFRNGELKPPVRKPISVSDIVGKSGIDKGGNLGFQKGMELLSRFGIPTARFSLVKSSKEAETAAQGLDLPIVVKAEIPHKTDKGLVRIVPNSKTAVITAFQEIEKSLQSSPETAGCGILVQEMVKGGIEVIIGVKNDPIFGPTVLFGMGGILAELMKDVSLRVCPLSLADVREMMSEVKGLRLLKDFRGQGSFDIPALEDTVLKVSDLAHQLKDRVTELDINPLIVLPEGKGLRAVDVLVTLK
jgi:acetyltransferase